jgi:hypothetical protein
MATLALRINIVDQNNVKTMQVSNTLLLEARVRTNMAASTVSGLNTHSRYSGLVGHD